MITPPPGAPDIAGEIVEAVKPNWVGLDRDQWGLDHGTWSVLAHLYPQANIPVLQLSINALKPLDYHLELAGKLAALREKGVLIVGSGNVVHNLRAVRWSQPDMGFDWAHRFDDAVAEQMSRDPAAILKVVEHPNFEAAVPTPDHFIPLLYTAGIAAAGPDPAHAIVRGYALGSISMTCYGVGCEAKVAAHGASSATAATTPSIAPADQSNI